MEDARAVASTTLTVYSQPQLYTEARERRERERTEDR
jgi:hypothetical protein